MARSAKPMSSALPPELAPASRSFQEDRQPCPYGSPLHGLVNLARISRSVRMSPAMAARVTERLWDIGDIVELEWEAQA